MLFQNTDVSKHQCFKTSMLQNSNVSKLQCFKTPMFQNSNASNSMLKTPMFQNSNVSKLQSFKIPIFSDIPELFCVSFYHLAKFPIYLLWKYFEQLEIKYDDTHMLYICTYIHIDIYIYIWKFTKRKPDEFLSQKLTLLSKPIDTFPLVI